jgi:hypothetical protein
MVRQRGSCLTRRASQQDVRIIAINRLTRALLSWESHPALSMWTGSEALAAGAIQAAWNSLATSEDPVHQVSMANLIIVLYMQMIVMPYHGSLGNLWTHMFCMRYA